MSPVASDTCYRQVNNLAGLEEFRPGGQSGGMQFLLPGSFAHYQAIQDFNTVDSKMLVIHLSPGSDLQDSPDQA